MSDLDALCEQVDETAVHNLLVKPLHTIADPICTSAEPIQPSTSSTSFRLEETYDFDSDLEDTVVNLVRLI